MYVPTRLRVLRIKYKITLKALAGRMNISNQHLSRMELADIPPTEYHEHLLYPSQLYQCRTDPGPV